LKKFFAVVSDIISCILNDVSNVVELGHDWPVVQHLLDLQDGCGGYLGKWPYASVCVLFELSWSFTVGAFSFVKIGQYLLVLKHLLDFQNGSGGHL
jgi:hypothetical protein